MNEIRLEINDIINRLDIKIQNDLSCLYQPYISKFKLNSPLILLKTFGFDPDSKAYKNWVVNLLKYF